MPREELKKVEEEVVEEFYIGEVPCAGTLLGVGFTEEGNLTVHIKADEDAEMKKISTPKRIKIELPNSYISKINLLIVR